MENLSKSRYRNHKYKQPKKTLPLFLVISLSLFFLSHLFSSCSAPKNKTGEDYIFKYDLLNNPKTLDPQTSADEQSSLIMQSLFSGLLKTDPSGNITSAIAAEYKISADLLTYTFYLKDNVLWTNNAGFEAKCTANDFVFAFHRLMNPKTKSRNAAKYFSIKNAYGVNSGTLPLEALGIKAVDDYTLTIELEQPNSDFPALLTMPPAYPCNEEFYIKTEGRYGLTAETVPSNGDFYLKEWVYDPHWTYENRITLRRNALNHKTEKTSPLGINFLLDRTGDSPLDGMVENFTSGATDCIITNASKATALIKKNYPYKTSETSVWGISFNENNALGDENLRKTLSQTADIKTIPIDQTGFRKTSSLIPDTIKIGDSFFSDLIDQKDLNNLENITNQTNSITPPLTSVGDKIQTPTLIIPITPGYKEVDALMRTVIQRWQEKLSLFCRVEVLSTSDYESRLFSGDYDIAIKKITAEYNSPSSILTPLSTSPETTALIEKAKTSKDKHESAENYYKAMCEILEKTSFIPICLTSDYFFSSKKSENLVYNPFTKAIDFKNATAE